MTYIVLVWKQISNKEARTPMEEIRTFSSWRKANRYYQKKRRTFAEKWSWVNGEHGHLMYEEYSPGGCDKDGDGPYVSKQSYRPDLYGPNEGVALTTNIFKYI